jgi:hypothetical protein
VAFRAPSDRRLVRAPLRQLAISDEPPAAKILGFFAADSPVRFRMADQVGERIN